MSLLTDQEKQDIAEAVVHMSFDINYAESIAHVCELAEAAVIRKLATVSVEPDLIKTDEVDRYGDSIYIEAYSTEALAAARAQALEEAAKRMEGPNNNHGAVIRALIGCKDD